jgi:predicted nuclease of predicted toxin-antitoxin system
LRFLIDAQLPPRLAQMLRRAGHEAEHVFDLGMVAKPDIEIWRYAERTAAVIITKDADFAAMHIHAGSGPAVVWVKSGNITNMDLERTLLMALREIVAAVGSRERLIEVR